MIDTMLYFNVDVHEYLTAVNLPSYIDITATMLLSLETRRLRLVLVLNVSVQHEMLAPYQQSLQVISAPTEHQLYCTKYPDLNVQ